MDTFLLGPFNFATINGRKTRDRIAREHWQLLLDRRGRYDNKPPRLESHLQGITCYIDTPYHSEYFDETIESSIHQHLFNAFYAS